MLFVELSEEVSYINILESIFVYFSLKRIYYNINAKHNVAMTAREGFDIYRNIYIICLIINRIKPFILLQDRIRTMITILFVQAEYERICIIQRVAN